MTALPPFHPETFHQWLRQAQHQQYLDALMRQVGVTRQRAECFIRLWLYLVVKDSQTRQIELKLPLSELPFPQGWVECSCREAAELFYSDRERGSDRSAGMMLDKLMALGLIRKKFDGNCTQIEIQVLPEFLKQNAPTPIAAVAADAFDLRSDAVPIANLLANNYHWLNRNADAAPYRIANILRDWAEQYATGMRVLRRCDNQNPVGFYALYPVARESEVKFFHPPSQGLHFSRVTDVDPFVIAQPGDETCRAVFVRSWMIDRHYQHAQASFLKDAQQTLVRMQQDFPNLWDMYTLIIHPSYEELGRALGFQKNSPDPKLPLYWMYQAVDRFLALDMDKLWSEEK
jgi:hypothetical protein